VNADGTTPKDLISAGADGTKVLSIACTSDDTSDVVMQVFVHDGTTAYLVGSVNVPTLSGTDGTVVAVDLLSATDLPWLDADGEFFIPTGYKVQVAPLAAVTAAKTVTVVCLAGDY
jgi:threonine synthase